MSDSNSLRRATNKNIKPSHCVKSMKKLMMKYEQIFKALNAVKN
jgi:hypothetical protein